MRTTVRLDETLMRSVKSYAARHGSTFTSVLEDALRRLLAEEEQRQAGARVEVVTFAGASPPRIEITDRAAVQRALDDEDAQRFLAATRADS